MKVKTPGNFGNLKLWLFGALFLLVAGDYFLLGPWSFMNPRDNLMSAVLHQEVIGRLWRSYGSFYWFPHLASGVDALGLPSVPWSLTNLLFILLPGWIAVQLITALELAGVIFFSFRILRDHLKTGREPALLGAAYVAVFCNPGYLHNQLLYAQTCAFLWFFLGGAPSISGWKRLALSAALGLFAGLTTNVFMVAYCLALGGLLVLFDRREPLGKKGLGLLFYGAPYLLVQLPVVLAVGRFISPLSQRAKMETVINWADWNLPKLLAPHWGALFLILAALLVMRAARARLLPLLPLLVFSVVFFDAYTVVKAVFGPQLPSTLRGLNPHFEYMIPVLLGLCGGVAVDALSPLVLDLRTSRGLLASLRSFAIPVGFLVVAWAAIQSKIDHFRDYVSFGNYPAWAWSAPLRELQGKEAPSFGRYRAVVVNNDGGQVGYFMQSLANAAGFETIDGYANFYPFRYKDFWRKVLEPSKTSRLSGGVQKDPYVPVFYFNEGDRTADYKIEFPRFYNKAMLSLTNTRYVISRSEISDPELKEIYRPAEVLKSGIAASEKAVIRLKENFRGMYSFFVYENPLYFPRAFFVTRAKLFGDEAAVLAALGEASAEELRTTVFLDSSGGLPFQATDLGGTGGGQVDISRYEPDLVALSVNAASNGVLFLSNSYSPYWHAYVDGQPAQLFPANHAFWGVFLRAGRRSVELRFEPPYARAGGG